MPAANLNDLDLIDAAQSGDRQAADALLRKYLPFVYTLVRRAIGDTPDADDVVQETMLRALADLDDLRSPERFRAWLAAIGVHQVGTYLRRHRRAAYRRAGLEEVDESATGSSFEDTAVLRLDLSRERHQVVESTQWLDPDDRLVLSLWWLEVAGQLSRGELATAIGVSLAHAGVRVQRTRAQLDVARSVVAALHARPGCPRLAALAGGWNGEPNPLWRKRFARHVRDCDACRPAGRLAIAPEHLLAGYGLLPVPVALAGGLLGPATGAGALAGAAKGGLLGHLAHLVAAHPVAAALATTAVAAGATVTVVSWPSPPPQHRPPAVARASPATSPRPSLAPLPSPAGIAPPSPSSSAAARSVTTGRLSLDADSAPGSYIAITTGDVAVLAPLTTVSPVAARQLATFEVVAGLRDPACFSFRSADGRYLRHASWRLRLNKDEGTTLYRGDATFCVRPGPVAGSVLLESSNYPGWFVHLRGTEVWVDHSDGSAAFLAAAAFRPRVPLAG
ncbi:sigma-70 family RNA polymerase sigma factor [Hamadaea tsunoensis]|uniref:sigma-70 family RNA polymerase sigma factor n=1 Tax=Hamadaea tsunoensis TaxID=53368 RepID=UPI000417553B|nr:sigma-70 family RNA polymerase sigma factor [Hamadaea tsunoensis]